MTKQQLKIADISGWLRTAATCVSLVGSALYVGGYFKGLELGIEDLGKTLVVITGKQAVADRERAAAADERAALSERTARVETHLEIQFQNLKGMN